MSPSVRGEPSGFGTVSARGAPSGPTIPSRPTTIGRPDRSNAMARVSFAVRPGAGLPARSNTSTPSLWAA